MVIGKSLKETSPNSYHYLSNVMVSNTNTYTCNVLIRNNKLVPFMCVSFILSNTALISSLDKLCFDLSATLHLRKK